MGFSLESDEFRFYGCLMVFDVRKVNLVELKSYKSVMEWEEGGRVVGAGE